MTKTTSSDKVNPFLLSEQVRVILQKAGHGKNFNYTDYEHFKKKAKRAFNKAHEIAKLFIDSYGESNSDFNEYIF